MSMFSTIRITFLVGNLNHICSLERLMVTTLLSVQEVN